MGALSKARIARACVVPWREFKRVPISCVYGVSPARLPSVLSALPGAGQTGWPGAVAGRARMWSWARQTGSAGSLNYKPPRR